MHDLGWVLELDQHRTLTIRDRDGRVHATVPLLHATRINRPADPTPIPDGESPPGRPPDQLTLSA